VTLIEADLVMTLMEADLVMTSNKSQMTWSTILTCPQIC
jgi:hypothetical protein